MSEKIPVTKSSLPDFEEYLEEIRSIWDSHWLTNCGEKHKILEKKLCGYLGTDFLELVVNGHAALELAFQAMGIEGEVITTPYTFVSTTSSIIRSGLTPVFCDINPDDYTIDVSKIEELITNKTSAIVPVHVYGNVCDVDGIFDIAQKYNLKVIYDAAHAFGVKYRGVGIGTYGDASCFSFHATKVFNTIEGGAICSNDEALNKKIQYMKNFGISSQENICEIGTNAKMNEFAAAMGICNLKHVDDEIKKRKTVFERYFECLSGIKGLRLIHIKNDATPNYAYFPVVFDEKLFGASRDEIYEALRLNGIYARKYFSTPTNKIACFQNKIVSGNTPVAWDISNRVIALPLYPDLSDDSVDKICKIILNLRK